MIRKWRSLVALARHAFDVKAPETGVGTSFAEVAFALFGGDRRAVFREHRKESRAAFGFVRGEFDRAREHDGFEGGREFFRIGLDVGRDDEGRGAGLLQGFPLVPALPP